MTANDSGTYCCSGYLNSKHWEESDKCSSQPLKITVLKGELVEEKGNSPYQGKEERLSEPGMFAACRMGAITTN